MTITNGKNAQKKSAPSVEPERVSDGGGTIYGPDSHPPLQTLVVNAVQHTGVILFNMLSVVGVLAVCGLSETAVRDQVAWVLISLAIISILMTYRRGPIGAGLLLTVIPSSVFLSPALAAAREGGLPLVAGMIIFSGVLVVILTPLIPRLRPYFSAEIAGIVVLIIGIDLSAKSLSYILDKGGANSSFGYYSYAISFASLATTIVISVWIGGALSNYAILLGLLAGVIAWFAVSAATGVPMPNFSESAILSLPQLKWEGLSFQTDLMLAYGVATFAFVLTTMGILLTLFARHICPQDVHYQWWTLSTHSMSRQSSDAGRLPNDRRCRRLKALRHEKLRYHFETAFSEHLRATTVLNLKANLRRTNSYTTCAF